jgi:archaellum component FlaG (FlaF/FlaG flagellin family)
MYYLMHKRFGAWVLLLLLLHLLLPASLLELDTSSIEANARQISQSSPISIISFQTDPSPVFVGQNFTYKVKVKNLGDETISILPLIFNSDERFDPPDSVIIVEDDRPRIFVVPIELYPGEVVDVGPHAIFSARRVGEVRITVDVSWSYSGDPGSWYIASGNFSFMVYESQQETYEIYFLTDPPDVGSITFSGTTYTNGQSGKYAAGTYQIEANVPEGYVFDGWLFYGTQYGEQPPPIEFEDPRSPSTKVIIRGGGTIATIFKWIVKLRGTVARNSMNEYEIYVRIDELLLDTSGRLRLGEEIWVYNPAFNWQPGWVKEGDRVEIYGLGFCGSGPLCQRHGIVIKWSEHYVRRVEAVGIKFRGVVWSEPNAPYDIEVMIDEVLLDPEGRLSPGSLAHVDIVGDPSRCECDWPLHRGERVEVYARHYSYDGWGNYSVAAWIYSRDHPYDGYIRRTAPFVDVWTNKGGQGVGNLDGGQYSIGESITLYCSVSTNVDSLRIKVIRPDGVEVIALDRGPSSAGTYQASGTVGEPAGERRVICEARSGDQTSSDEVRFTVTQPPDTTPPTVRVIAPNGGETLFPGNVFRIRWEASDNVGVAKVHIWLFQGNEQVMVIARDLPNTGYYDWTVPNRPGTNYRIRIAAVDAAGNAGYDDSDGTFEIGGEVRVTAQIISLTTDKNQYNPRETVRIRYTIRNTGDVRIELRMVVEIVDPSGRSVYDSHRLDQDRRHDLDPGQTASGEFTWTIPADAVPGTYEVRASLRHWNIWDKIFDYRWGDRPGPRFTVQAAATATLQVGIRHTYIGDLKIWVGVEGGREVLIWNREGGGTRDLFKEWNLLQLGFTVNDLPPSESKRWYLRIRDEAGGDEGRLEYFRIIYQGRTYESQDRPEIKDFQEVRAWIPSRGAPSLPDLTVRNVNFSPQSVSQGGSITVSWTEVNIGSGNAGPYRVGIYLGVSEYGRDHLLGSFNRDGLAAGDSKRYTQTFTVPSSIPPGGYYVTIFIDDLRVISEANEENNIGSSTPNRLEITITRWETLRTVKIRGTDDTEVVFQVRKLGVNKVGEEQWFIFSIEIRDIDGQMPRDRPPFIRGGKLYVCYDRRTGPNVELPTRWVPIPPNTEFGWYYTEYRQWGRVLLEEYKNALKERGERETAQRIAENALFSAISMRIDLLIRNLPEFWSWLKSFLENILNIILTWLGFSIIPEYRDPTYPDSFRDIVLNKNEYVCHEIIIVTKPRYLVGIEFEGVTGWSADYIFIFPYPGNQQLIIWFYIQYDRVRNLDAYIKLPREERVVINIVP